MPTMLTNILTTLRHMTLADVLDICLIAVILYSVFLLIKDTKAYQMAIGLGFVGLLFLATIWGKLVVSNRIIKYFINYLIIAVIVLFQAEIRRFLTGIGSQTFRKPQALRSLRGKLEDVFLALDYMSQKKIGALIAIEKGISLSNYADRGTEINAILSKDLLVSLFYPHSPLHDGAVIIQGDTIVSAGCLLPLPATHNISHAELAHTRHLAALGLAQETDAAVIVVSEETGTISLAVKGYIQKFASKDDMKAMLISYLRDGR
jgi:diadenylate cyclase